MLSTSNVSSVLNSNANTNSASASASNSSSANTSNSTSPASSSLTLLNSSSSSSSSNSSALTGSPILNDDSNQSSLSTIQLYNSVDSSQQSSPSANAITPTASSSIYTRFNLDAAASNLLLPSSDTGALIGEPELKKVKLTHYQLNSSNNNGNLKANDLLTASNYFLNDASLHNFLMAHKKLEERLGGILCCTVCLDLPTTAIFQCSNGHLVCAGCYAHLMADSRLKDENASCPNCRCEIGKNLCSRNLAVEKALAELPASCIYCHVTYARNSLDFHQRNECLERPIKCVYERIGCTWEGPFHELDEHSSQCAHPNKQGREIINALKEKDAEADEEQQSTNLLISVLSFEKVCFNDLQFKQYKTDEITPKIYFETNRFNAFFHQWVIKARVNDNQKNPNLSLNRFLSYQLILKSKLSSNQTSFEVKFCILKGPYGEVQMNPRVQTFEFNQNKLETDYIRLNMSSSDCNKLLGSKTINFRFFMFQP